VVIDCGIRETSQYDLKSFLKDIDCTGMQFNLLCFWGRHPRAKLSLYTIAGALNTSAIKLRDAITNLVEKGILTAEHSNNGLTTYALSEQRAREYVDELGGLDWKQTMDLIRQWKKEAVLTADKSE